MQVAPGETYDTVVDWGTTGIAGTLGVTIKDDSGATVVARLTSNITEWPGEPGVYLRTGNAAPTAGGEYLLVWDDGVDEAFEELEVSLFVASEFETPTLDAYATVDEFFRIVKIRTPTTEQTVAAQRVLVAAAGE